ncbi:Tetratricopeptide-like helical [Penicillium expansum]|uniref:Tetratricopeptide-like helical n=1 Tax=Penicillium expansum TaxID=27334 RepID=A0A0A2JBC4_PENEN|nr:Tetratricopeptide-like helical [Penicillium expansum]KGO52106.1 Tetratricopeptide-like helical [Penicillium expansum]
MVVTAREPSDSSLPSLWHSACQDYGRETGISLTDERFPKVQGPEDLSRQLESERDNFEDFRMKKRPLLHAMQMVLAPFESWGDLIAGAAAAAFPPASSIMGAMLLMIRAARRVSDAFNVIVDLFQKLGNIALRLDSYKGVTPSEGMKIIIVKVLVNFLRVCAASQKLLSHGSLKARFSKWAKNILVEDTSISSLLDNLEELTNQEHMMVSAHGLNLTHQALRNTEELLNRDDDRKNRERLERIKAALDPVSASGQVFSSITQNRIPGSGSWVEDRLRSWWQGSQPLLWIHGGPGVGKSHLASKIITEFSNESSATPAPVVASFFHRNNDVDLRSLNKALRTIAWQLATQQSSFAVHAEDFCMKEDPENNYVLWEKLFLNYFTDDPPVTTACLVIDGIDEAETEEQDVLFSLLESSFLAEDDISRTSPLRIVLLSRDSVRSMLDEHSLSWIPEIEVGNNENKEDLHEYVSQKLQKTKLFRGYPHLLEETIEEISQEAEGMWEWATLVIRAVLRCRTKEQIRKVIRTMPRGISAMLREELQRLSKELSEWEELSGDEASERDEPASQIQQLNILLSFVALAQKPLTVRQLEIILELILKEEFMGLEDDIRTLYSSLFYIRANDEDNFDEEGDVVTLRHSSFYEFFRTSAESAPIHVNVDQAEVNFLYVFLYSLKENQTPYSNIWIGYLWEYAEKFIPSHLTRANPEKAGNLREDISTLLASLFRNEQDREWSLREVDVQGSASYSTYPSCDVSELGSYWLDAHDQDTANKRAEAVLHWLLPDSKQSFVDQARASAMTSDACPFTVLFSLMVARWIQRWLEPEEIKHDDGLPAVAPAILTVYNTMEKGIKESDAGSLTSKVSDVMWNDRDPTKVLIPAQSQKLQQTAMWHARVAQALLLKNCFVQALEHFQVSLDKNHATPTFSTQSLFVIHRDMARAYTQLVMHKEALEHLELSESLRSTFEEDDSRDDLIDGLLNKAQMKHHAKLTDDAIATAEEAWNLLLERRGKHDDDFFPFLSIFLELNQTHRLRSVLDLAFTHFEETADSRGLFPDFERFILGCSVMNPRIIYRVIHYALTPQDQDYLDLTTGALKKIDTQPYRPEELRFLLATALFEKGRRDVGVQGWYETASLSSVSPSVRNKACRKRSIAKITALCLEDADIPFWERPALILNENSELGDICLVLSSWLRARRDITNARDVLRWCVKECFSLLSDDDPSNDINAFVRLFRVSLAVTHSDEDLGAALYLIKQHTEPRRRVAYNRTVATELSDDDAQLEVSSTLQNVQLTADEDQCLDGGTDDHIDDALYTGIVCDLCTECSSCKREIGSVHHWYFCRSCALSTLCWRCYRQCESGDLSKIPGICDPEHKFFYTGPLLRPSERVPKGMVPLISSDGAKEIIRIEEWKDRLAEKWETADFTFEGGLSAWCMRVLPEPQRTRWATFFQT